MCLQTRQNQNSQQNAAKPIAETLTGYLLTVAINRWRVIYTRVSFANFVAAKSSHSSILCGFS